jgi:hypothetical protein
MVVFEEAGDGAIRNYLPSKICHIKATDSILRA